MIPRHPRGGTWPAPDQIFSAGFRDGLAHRPLHPRFQHHQDYLKGYAEGSRWKQGEPLQAPLKPFFEWSDLGGALNSIRRWEKEQERFDLGRVALSFRDGWWIVLISEDLYQAALHS